MWDALGKTSREDRKRLAHEFRYTQEAPEERMRH
jgi:hypothetical protein